MRMIDVDMIYQDLLPYSNKTREFVMKIINAQPTVEPQPKTGRWIKTYEPNDAEPFILWMCSECQNAEHGIRSRSKYCPNCGTKMEVEE